MGANGGTRRLDRSQSEVIGVVLVLGMVIAGSLAVLALGATAIGDTESQLSADRAEQTLTQLSSTAGLVALGEADTQRVSLPSGSGEEFWVDESEGRLTVELTNRTTEESPEWLDGPLADVRLGAVEYETDETTVAYQGGGVFRLSGDRGTMVSPPEFHYRNGTLTLPVVNVTGEGTAGQGATVSGGEETRAFPLPDSHNFSNPLDNHEVVVTVQSTYYEGWGQYFEQRTDGDVEYDHGANEVTLTLVTAIGDQTYEDAVATTAGDFDIQGTGGGVGDATIDSYNSSVGSYDSQTPTGANMSVSGHVELGGQSYIQGNVTAESFECGGTAGVSGTVRTVDGPQTGGNCSPDTDSLSSVPESDSIEPYVSSRLDDLEDEGPPGNELTAGTYYGENVNDIESVDTTAGDVVLGVDTLTVDTPVEVEGENEFRVIVNDTVEVNAPLTAEDTHNATITTVLGGDGFEATVNEEFVGSIFAPGVDSDVSVDSRVFGAVVASSATVENGEGRNVHFDEALENEQTVPEDASVVRITYLHVTENEIRID